MLKLHETTLPIYEVTIIFTQSRKDFTEYFELTGYDEADADALCCWDENNRTVGVFVEFGEAYNATIGYWDYDPYVIEVEEATNIIIHLTTGGSIDINQYLISYMSYDDYWSCNQSQCTFEITVQPGYSVFEAENMDENANDITYSIWFEEVE